MSVPRESIVLPNLPPRLRDVARCPMGRVHDASEYRRDPAEFKAWQIKDAVFRKARRGLNCWCHDDHKISAGAYYKLVFTAGLQPVCLACFGVAERTVGPR